MAASQELGAELPEKVLKFETFLNEQLRPDLQFVLEARDKLYSEIAEFLALKNSILAVQAAKLKPDQPLKTKVDLGCNFYCQAHVKDPNYIYVDIGLGCFVQFTLDEAVRFIDKRTKLLEEKAKKLTYQTTKIKANIKLVLQGLRELQNIPEESAEKQPSRVDPMF